MENLEFGQLLIKLHVSVILKMLLYLSISWKNKAHVFVAQISSVPFICFLILFSVLIESIRQPNFVNS